MRPKKTTRSQSRDTLYFNAFTARICSSWDNDHRERLSIAILEAQHSRPEPTLLGFTLILEIENSTSARLLETATGGASISKSTSSFDDSALRSIREAPR